MEKRRDSRPPSGIGPPVEQAFFDQPTEKLALALLGQILVHESPEGTTAGRIVEVEMYRGPGDKGAHSYGGRPTPRTKVMYGPPGYAYVYLIYGMYYCLNVVAAPTGAPEAILLRAIEPLAGWDLMARRRHLSGTGPTPRARAKIASGPGRLAQALGITKAYYGHPLWQAPLYIAAPDDAKGETAVCRGPRINIHYAEEARDFPWRFWICGHPSVSR